MNGSVLFDIFQMPSNQEMSLKTMKPALFPMKANHKMGKFHGMQLVFCLVKVTVVCHWVFSLEFLVVKNQNNICLCISKHHLGAECLYWLSMSNFCDISRWVLKIWVSVWGNPSTQHKKPRLPYPVRETILRL